MYEDDQIRILKDLAKRLESEKKDIVWNPKPRYIKSWNTRTKQYAYVDRKKAIILGYWDD